MKCLYCEKEFKLIPIGKSGGNNRNFCYNCVPINYTKSERNRRIRELMLDKTRKQKQEIGCQLCGYNKNGAALEWHHSNSAEKDNDPSSLLNIGNLEGWKRYQEEIKKCILLCSNCHREIHNPEKEIEVFDTESEIELLHHNIIDEFELSNSIRQVAQKLNLSEFFVTSVLKYYNIKINSSYKGLKVLMLDKKTKQVIKEFPSIREASCYVIGNDSGNSHISMVCKGKRKSAYGYC